jgi:hypothetical protein
MIHFVFVLVPAACIGRQHKFSSTLASNSKKKGYFLAENYICRNTKRAKRWKLSGGELNPGLLRVVLANDKQKY